MPSPFPGMDPYLEHPDIFPDFHDRFITHLSESLQPQLPPPYYAAIGRRAWIEVSERYVGPDVQVATTGKDSSKQSAVALAARPEPIVIHVPHDEQIEPLVEIFIGRGRDRRLVTAIEMLSSTNKSPGEHGRDLYLRKQAELLKSNVHLVEIDLLRGGRHTTAVPEERLAAAAGEFDYHACVHRFDKLEDFLVFPFVLSQRLPELGIPLLPGDGEAPLDLQSVFEKTYAAGPYSREIDYAADSPEPPLSAEQRIWAAKLIAVA